MSLRVLTVGTNPNLAFYAWRLYESRCQVTMVNPSLRSSTISFESDTLGDSSFKPTVVSSLAKLSGRFDVVILSGSSLQDFQNLNLKIHSFINDDSLVVIELSGYINLEPFMTLKNPTLSIMNEAEIKQSANGNSFFHSIKNKDFRIYLGATTIQKDASVIKLNRNFQAFYELLNNWSNSKQINLLTSLNPKEFLTYQWKLALPKIVFAPLSIIFECEFPENLQAQILCKPLISGIIQELFKIIKKMDCKLVKGYENETNLLNNWIHSYPATKSNHHYINSPPLLYNFLNNFDLEIDLLLLQPILLADDYNIKSPYLENLYSTLCQFLKINNRESKFFTRLNGQENGKKAIHEDTKGKSEELSALLKNISKNKILNNQLNDDITTQESKVFKLNDDMEAMQSKLDGYTVLLIDKESQLRHLDELISGKNATIESTKQKSLDADPQVFAELEQQLNEKEEALKQREQELAGREQALRENNSSTRNAQPQLYVDTNGSRSQKVQSAPQNQHRDLQLNQQQPQQPQQPLQQQYNNQQYNNQPYNNQVQSNGPGNQVPNQQQFNQKVPNQQQQPHQQFNSQPQQYQPQQNLQQPFQQQYQQPQQQQQQNGYFPSPIDQLPPHGLPQNGLPQNALPPNLRGNSMTGGANRYQQLQVQQNQQPNRQQHQQHRLSSIQSVQSMSEPHYNHPSFNNAAPIDPIIGQRFKNKPKNANRRSAFPQMSGNLDGLDMGGRGGMPMPNANKNRASTGNLLNNAIYSSPPLGAQKKNMSNGHLSNQFQGMNMNQGQPEETQNNGHYQHGHPASSGSGSSNSNASFGQHLAPPASNGSYGQHLAPPNGVSTTSTSSTNTDDSPKTSTDTNNHAPIFNEAGAKPLGAGLGNVATTDKKKKKKGIFGRK